MCEIGCAKLWTCVSRLLDEMCGGEVLVEVELSLFAIKRRTSESYRLQAMIEIHR